MRKRRAVILDDDPILLGILRFCFEAKGYDVVTLSQPAICSVYDENAPCRNLHPCADILLTDLRMPKMTGLEILQAQLEKGCRLTIRNKAIMSGFINADEQALIERLGCACFTKPFALEALDSWIAACEERMDLSRPLAPIRKEKRTACCPGTECTLQINGDAYSGTALNWSTSGLCVSLYRPLTLHQIVTVATSVALASSQAVVRWVRDAGDGSYLAGLSCC